MAGLLSALLSNASKYGQQLGQKDDFRYKLLEGPVGFEPTTPGLKVCGSRGLTSRP